MEIYRVSLLSKKHYIWDIDITPEQYDRWDSGELIQNVCPFLDSDEREFIISGIIPSEWAELNGLEPTPHPKNLREVPPPAWFRSRKSPIKK